ncbi:hypothetical protein PR001_g12245 [Phytophthora rubi]|nr:hypothetical protein PR001_g12245 [Phytophthora rubi]
MADVADVRHEISLVLQERALQELAAPLAVLRRRVYDEFKRKRSSFATLNGILRTRGVTIIKNLIIVSNRRLESRDVTCDFELALINAVINQFPRANVVDCLFHWKQALHRKMLDLGISREKIFYVMKPGKLDVLTIIPADEVLDKGLRYVRSIIDDSGAKTKWNTFWKHFVRQWTKRYDMSLWNVSQMRRNNVSMVNRTNNPLEK